MLEKLLLPLVLATLMLGLGMSLVPADFKRVLQRAHVALTGLGSLLLLMPILALVVARLLGLDPVLTMGLVLLATCPGGMFSNLVTHTAGGDLALSMTLTIGSSFLYVLTAPMVLTATAGFLASDQHVFAISFTQTCLEILLVVLLPVGVGMLLRYRIPAWCLRHERQVRNVASAFIVLVFIYLGVDQGQLLATSGLRVAGAVLLLNALGWMSAMLLALVLRLSRQELIAVGVEHSIRQEGTGVFIAATIIGSTQMTLPLLLNSVIGLVLSSTLLLAMRARARQARVGGAVA